MIPACRCAVARKTFAAGAFAFLLVATQRVRRTSFATKIGVWRKQNAHTRSAPKARCAVTMRVCLTLATGSNAPVVFAKKVSVSFFPTGPWYARIRSGAPGQMVPGDMNLPRKGPLALCQVPWTSLLSASFVCCFSCDSPGNVGLLSEGSRTSDLPLLLRACSLQSERSQPSVQMPGPLLHRPEDTQRSPPDSGACVVLCEREHRLCRSV